MKPVLVMILFLLSGAALYYPCWSNPFVLDDLTKIQDNLDLRVPFSLQNFVYPYQEPSMHFRNDPSRPLTFIAYWLCWHMDNGSPLPFHLAGTLLHSLSAALLALWTASILQRLFGTGSLLAGGLAGLLFLTSPLIAGTAVYSYGLSDVLGTFFLLVALLLFSCSSTWWAGIFGTLIYALALASKQSTIVLPGLLLAQDMVTQKLEAGRLRRIYLPLTLMGLGYLGLRLFYFGALGDIEGQGNVIARDQYFWTQGLMMLKYIGLTLWPSHLSVDHRELPWDLPVGEMILAWAIVLLASGAAVVAALKKGIPPIWRLMALGWIFYLLCLLPVSSVFPTVDLLVERRAYSADLGLFFAFAGVLYYFWSRRQRWRIPICILCLGTITGQTVLALGRMKVYAAPELLWQEALNLDPQNPRALINLGVYYSSVGRFEESRQVLEALLPLQPDNGAIYSKLAYIYMQNNYAHHDLNTAWGYLQKSFQLSPDNIFALYNAGVVMMQMQRFQDAENYFARAATVAPQMTQALLGAGQAARAQNKKAVAEKYFMEVLRRSPNNSIARKELEYLHR